MPRYQRALWTRVRGAERLPKKIVRFNNFHGVRFAVGTALALGQRIHLRLFKHAESIPVQLHDASVSSLGTMLGRRCIITPPCNKSLSGATSHGCSPCKSGSPLEPSNREKNTTLGAHLDLPTRISPSSRPRNDRLIDVRVEKRLRLLHYLRRARGKIHFAVSERGH